MLVKKVAFLTYNKEKTASENLQIFGPLSYTKIQVVNGMEEGITQILICEGLNF